ncbi:uncharacterized protein LOC116427461 [Nomia melanderi]|uniref:uncharacterized protein LOC116427461 n=1 Tax=Nomia melanderi TaxID=2448451 RepID=UPI003FCE8A2F
MGPYLTRKRTLSTTESQKSQEKKETLVTKTISKLKSNTKKESETKDGLRRKNTRATALKNSSMKKQIDHSSETIKNDHKEGKRITRRKIIDKKEPEPAIEIVTNNSLSTNKQEPKNIKRRKIKKTLNKNVYNLRQTSLKESFLNQSKKKLLRARENIKSSENDLPLITQHLSPKKQNSVVLVKKLSTKKEKVPVYKCISPEHPVKNTSEIYEFNFDVNDSKERLPRKQRKRVIAKKTLLPKKKKIISKKYNVQNVVDHKTKPSNVEFKKGNIKSTNVKPKESDTGSINGAPKESNIESTACTESNIKSTNVVCKENNIKPTSVTCQEVKEKKLDQPLQVNISMEPSNEVPLPENGEKSIINNTKLNTEPLAHPISDGTNTESPVNNIIKKLTIVSTQDLSNQKISIMDNSQFSKSNDFKPFRPTNIFNNKLTVHQKNSFNNSLFEKSLSPITKLSENCEYNSPWRVPPPLFTFSQVRNVFQSTPQNKKYDIFRKTLSRVTMNESKNNENAARGKDVSLRNNENVSLEGYKNTNYSRKKNSTTSRKFGTEITNIDHSVPSNVGEEIRERISNEIENVQPNVQSSNRVNTSVDHFSTHHNIENRVNNVINPRSPKKVVKIDKNKIRSPQKIVENIQMHDRKENLDPQPGPSGLQKNRVLSEQRNVLRQSNLNNFLNIMDMPQSTSFKTAHGIFDDGPSTPISAKSTKQSNKSNLDVQDAFGFSDDDSNEDISPVKHKITTNESQKRKPFTTNSENNEKLFTKFPMSKIENKLLVKNPLRDVTPVKDIKNEDVIKKVPLKAKQDMHIDTSNFSDTFDVLSEMGESSMVNTSELPLFVDPEPSHFTEPPKHSYKRKRNVKFSFSDEEYDEEELPQYEVKRMKTHNMKKNQEKRLIEWVENINKTFDEIDQYELLIE